MIIDFHTHALPPSVKSSRGLYLEKDAAFAAIYSGEKTTIATAEDLIAAMDRDAVDFSVIVNYSWTTHSFCVETNNYLLEMAAKYPKRLAVFCAVSSLTEDASLKEIERCAAAGAKGVGEIRPDLMGIDFTRKDVIKPFADVVRQNNLIVLTHSSEPVGHIYPGKGAATPGLLYSFITGFPDITLVCAHWGGGLPFYALMPEVKAALSNTYFDTAVSPFLYQPEIYRQASRIIGAEHILLGSDFPVMNPGRILKELDGAGLTGAEKEMILSGNACRLLGING